MEPDLFNGRQEGLRIRLGIVKFHRDMPGTKIHMRVIHTVNSGKLLFNAAHTTLASHPFDLHFQFRFGHSYIYDAR